MDMIQEQLALRGEQAKKNAALLAIAQEQGLAIVQLSPRKFSVVKISKSSGFRLIYETYHTYLGTETVFTGKYDECLQYIGKNTKPLPPELTK